MLTKVKMALAVAIIKSKPRGVSGREFVETLASRLKNQDEKWKEKAEGLEEEVLRLRQELLLFKLKKSGAETAGDVAEVFSEDLFGSVKETCSTEQPLDSDSETPDLLLGIPSAPEATVTAPAAVPKASVDGFAAASVSKDAPVEDKLQVTLPHVPFLQSLLGLQRLASSDSLWLGLDSGSVSVMEDSVAQLLDSVGAALTESPGPGLRPSGDTVLQACEVSAQALEVYCSRRTPSVEFSGRAEETLRRLTEALLRSNQHSQFQLSERLLDCLMALGSSQMFKCFLIRLIISQLSALTEQLWHFFQAPDPDLACFPLDLFQNSCSLFWTLEMLLLKSDQDRFSLDLSSDQTGFIQSLEQRVFHLSHEFPLFSVYLWRVAGLLWSRDKTVPGPGSGPGPGQT